jgi:general stress protein 26
VDSINRNQPEDNRDDLQGAEAVKRIRDMVKKSPTCFFCTLTPPNDAEAARPMSVQEVDEQGNLWFLSASDSHKNLQIAQDPSVTLYFQGSEHSDFLQLKGTATISRDPAKIKELWEPILKTWFTEGEDDPRITVLKVTPNEGYYWDNKHGNLVAGIKILIGAAIGKTLDDSIEGTLKP